MMGNSQAVFIPSPTAQRRPLHGTLLIRARYIRCPNVNPHEPVGGKQILCIVGTDCCLDGHGEVEDEPNEKYVLSLKLDRNLDPTEMHFRSG